MKKSIVSSAIVYCGIVVGVTIMGGGGNVMAQESPGMVKFRQAVMACLKVADKNGYAGGFYQEGLTTYQTKKKEALQLDPALANFSGKVMGKSMADIRQKCDVDLPKKAGAAAEKDAETAATDKRLTAESQKREAAAQAAEAAEAAKMQKLLKGDRLNIWKTHGNPSDFPGSKVEKANYWVFESSYTDGTTCRRQFWFAGNKLKRKSEKGKGCGN